MGAGIAVNFKINYGGLGELSQQNPKVGGVAILRRGKRFIYYLTTKRLSLDKPTYADLHRSLYEMKLHMYANGVRKLAIPKLGCGLDQLEWRHVYQILECVFGKHPIEVVLYEYFPVRRVLFK